MTDGFRHGIRSSEQREIRASIEETFGVDIGDVPLDVLVVPQAAQDMILDGREAVGVYYDNDRLLTLHGAARFRPGRRLVTINEGAVEAVQHGRSKGASNLHRDGIVVVDDRIEEDDYVLLVSAETGEYVGVGRAEVGGEWFQGSSGKAVDVIQQAVGRDEVERVAAALDRAFDFALDGDMYELLQLQETPYDILLVDGVPEVFYHGDNAYPTIPAATEQDVRRQVVTVDEDGVTPKTRRGEVRRQVVNADEAIAKGDRVVIRNDEDGAVLGVGEALVDFDDWEDADSGDDVVDTVLFEGGTVARIIDLLSDPGDEQ